MINSDLFIDLDFKTTQEFKREDLHQRIDYLLDMPKDDLINMIENQKGCKLNDAELSQLNINFLRHEINIEYKCFFKLDHSIQK